MFCRIPEENYKNNYQILFEILNKQSLSKSFINYFINGLNDYGLEEIINWSTNNPDSLKNYLTQFSGYYNNHPQLKYNPKSNEQWNTR